MNTPTLGFGTAPIMGGVSRHHSIRALNHAFAAGIRHFDTARSYGWGEAESVVGSVLRHHDRATIRLVGKCGIMPVRGSLALGLAKSLARSVLSAFPALTQTVKSVAATRSFAPSATGSVEALGQSVAQSLQELGMHYFDLLLIHNFRPGMDSFDNIVSWLHSLRNQGIIRRYGFSVEGNFQASLEFLEDKGLLAEAVVQAPVCDDLLALPDRWSEVATIAHSPFQYLMKQAPSAGRALDLSALLDKLGAAGRCETVVCSMFTPEHIDRNIAAWKKSAAQVG